MRSLLFAFISVLMFSSLSCRHATPSTFEGTASERTVSKTFHHGMGWYNASQRALTVEFLGFAPDDDAQRKILEKGSIAGFDKSEPRVELTITFNEGSSTAAKANVRSSMIVFRNFSSTPMSSVNSGPGTVIDSLEGTLGSGPVSGHLKGRSQLGSVAAEVCEYDLTFSFDQK